MSNIIYILNALVLTKINFQLLIVLKIYKVTKITDNPILSNFLSLLLALFLCIYTIYLFGFVFTESRIITICVYSSVIFLHYIHEYFPFEKTTFND